MVAADISLYFVIKSLIAEKIYYSSFFSMRGGSRNAIAKKRTPIAKVKIKMYAMLSISQLPTYPASLVMIVYQDTVYKGWSTKIYKLLLFYTSSFIFLLSPDATRRSFIKLPYGGLTCHPLSGIDPTQLVLRDPRQHQQTRLGRLSENRARCDQRRTAEQTQHDRR